MPFAAVPALEQRGLVFIDSDEIDEILDSEVGEGHHAVLADPVDPSHRLRFPVRWRRRISSPRLRRYLGDPVGRRDVVDLVDMHDQAA